VELEALNERELGACMAIHMATVMCFAKLLEVNAFDQPDVEAYKDATRRILAGNT
jgi:glucose-6-phosphate isomerase